MPRKPHIRKADARNLYGAGEREGYMPDGGGTVRRFTKDAIGDNIAKAIRRAGQRPMPYAGLPWEPACLSFIVEDPALIGKQLATVEMFAKTFTDVIASRLMWVYAHSTVPHRSQVHSSPAEYKDHCLDWITFPDGTKSGIIYWPDIAWQDKFAADGLPIQATLGGPNVLSPGSAQSINARFGR